MDFGNHIVRITIRCDLNHDKVYGQIQLETDNNKTLDWLLNEFCHLKKIRRKPTFIFYSDNVNQYDLNSTLAECQLVDGCIIYVYNSEPSTSASNKVVRNFKCSSWWFVGLVTIFIGLVGFLLVIIIKYIPTSSNNVYGVVIDAGSSSSKVLIYQWTSPFFGGNGKVSEVSKRKTELSIDRPLGVEQMYNLVMLSIRTYIPHEKLAKSDVFLGATAGMRMLQDRNVNETAEIFSYIRKTLQKTGLGFSKPMQQARIIDGTEEALNSWITVNYLLNMFENNPSSADDSTMSFHSTVGSLDLGGASTQISFAIPIELAALAPMGMIADVSLYDKKYHVYSYSFLCYGKHEAQKRLWASLVKSQNFAHVIKNPCAPTGSIVNTTAANLFNVPCTRGFHARFSYGFDISLPSYIKDDVIFSFIGLSQPDKCQEVVNQLFNKSTCTSTRCSFNDVFQPNISGNFMAFSGFFYTMEFFNLTSDAKLNRQQATLQETKKTIENFCQLSWHQVKNIPVYDKEFLLTYCFDGYFVLQILLLYGFDNEVLWSKLKFAKKVENTSIGWSLGYMITSTGHIPQEKLFRFTIGTPLFTFLLILFTVFILLALLFFTLAYRHRRQNNSRYVRARGRADNGGDDAESSPSAAAAEQFSYLNGGETKVLYKKIDH